MRKKALISKKFKLIFLLLIIFTFQLILTRKVISNEDYIVITGADAVIDYNHIISTDLTNKANEVEDRIIVNYADSVSDYDHTLSPNLYNKAAEVDDRIIVNYADAIIDYGSIYSTNLVNIAYDVDERVIIDYADSCHDYDLVDPSILHQLFEGPSILINSIASNYFNNPPLMDVDFVDITGLDDAYYKVDSYTPIGTDITGWTEIFSDHTGTSYTTDFSMSTSIWATLSEGLHIVYFKTWDDSGYVTDGASHSLQFYKDLSGPLITVNNLNGNYYATPPTLNIDFSDSAGLNSAYYKVDTFTPTGFDTTNWIEIFSDFGGTSYTTDFIMNSVVWSSLSEGSHTVYFKVWDDLGNINDGSTPSWQFYKDTTKPSVILNTPNDTYHNSAPLIDVDFTDAAGLNAAYYKVDTYLPLGMITTGWTEIFSNYGGYSYTTDFTIDNNVWLSLSDGYHIMHFKVWDDLENIHDGPTPALGFYKDSLIPNITIKTPSANVYTFPPSIDVEILDNFNLDKAFYKVDSYYPLGLNTSGWIEIFNNYGSNNYSVNINFDSSLWNTLADSSHIVYFKTWDDAGNINDGIAPSWQFYKDSSGPIITINNIDGSPYNSVPTLDIDFYDSAGLDSAYYKLDSYLPTGSDTIGWIEIFSNYSGTSFTTNFIMSESVWLSLSEGSHIMYFKSWDDLSNINDGATPSWEFVVDFSAPEIILNLQNSTYYNIPPSIDVDFLDIGGLNSAYYKLDSFSPTGSNTTGWIEIFANYDGISYTTNFIMDDNIWASLSQGFHTVYFKVWDDLGNINDGASPSWCFNKDTVEPTITINTPIGKPFDSPPIFSVTFEDNYDLDSAYYKIDSYIPTGTDITGWQQIFIDFSGNSHTIDIAIPNNLWNSLEEGSYKVYIKCWDDLNNINDGPTPYWHFFKYFGIPIIKINIEDGNYFNSTPVFDVDFFDPTGLDAAYYKVDSFDPMGTNISNWNEIFYHLNSNNFTSNFVMDTYVWASLSEGSHVVYFKVWNYTSTINDGADPCWQFYKDTIPPEINLLSPGQNGIYQSSITVLVNITGYTVFHYCWDNNPFVITTLTRFTLPYDDGSHTLHIRAEDNAGNVKEVQYTFITDNTPPTAQIYGISEDVQFNGIETIRVSPNDAYGIDYVSFSINSELLSKKYSNYIYQFDTTQFPDGTYEFNIQIVDIAGNLLSRDFAIRIVNQVNLWEQPWVWAAIWGGLGFVATLIIKIKFSKVKKK